VEHEYMQDMALYPFTTVEQPSQRTKLAINCDPKGMLHSVHGTHLIGHRANPTDASCDIWRFTKGATAKQCLKETRWLEDLQFHIFNLCVLDLHIERALSFNASQVIRLDCSSFHTTHSLFGTAQHTH